MQHKANGKPNLTGEPDARKRACPVRRALSGNQEPQGTNGAALRLYVCGVYEDNLQGGCFHVEANSSSEAVAALERRDTPETAHIAYDFIVLVTLPGAQFNEYSAPDA